MKRIKLSRNERQVLQMVLSSYKEGRYIKLYARYILFQWKSLQGIHYFLFQTAV